MNRFIYFSAVTIITLLLSHTASAKMKLIFATQDFFPFSYSDEGKVKGPGAEIIENVCRKLRQDCEIKMLPWRRSQAMASSGQAHALFMVGKNKERESWLHFSPPIISTEYGFFECTEAPINYTDISSLKGKTVGVYGPSNTSHQLDEIVKALGGTIKINMTPDDLTQFKKLSRCRVDAVYSNKAVGFATIQQLNAKNINYAGPNKKIQYYIAFSQKHTPKDFVREFNTEITRMKKSGKIQQILDRYQMQASP